MSVSGSSDRPRRRSHTPETVRPHSIKRRKAQSRMFCSCPSTPLDARPQQRFNRDMMCSRNKNFAPRSRHSKTHAVRFCHWRTPAKVRSRAAEWRLSLVFEEPSEMKFVVCRTPVRRIGCGDGAQLSSPGARPDASRSTVRRCRRCSIASHDSFSRGPSNRACEEMLNRRDR